MFVLKIAPEDDLPEEFDARKEWPGLISPVLDQKDCGSSWAFSTAGTSPSIHAVHTIASHLLFTIIIISFGQMLILSPSV